MVSKVDVSYGRTPIVTGNQTINFSSGFGIASAAIVIYGRATTAVTRRANSNIGIGVVGS